MDYISTFIPKKSFLTRLETDGVPQVFAVAYIPPYYKVNQYWLRTTVRSSHTSSDVGSNNDSASVVGVAEQYEMQMYGFMLNARPDFDTSTGFDIMKEVFSLGAAPDINDNVPEGEENLADMLGITGNQHGKLSEFAEQHKFFERETLLGLPNNAVIIDSQQIMLTDSFSTKGSKLGRGTNISSGRFMVFLATAATPWREDNSDLSYTVFGSTDSMEDINADFAAAKYSARYGTPMDPSGYGSIATSGLGVREATNVFDESANTGSDSVIRQWMFTGFKEHSQIQEQTDIQLNVNSVLTLRCDAYEPRQNHIITT